MSNEAASSSASNRCELRRRWRVWLLAGTAVWVLWGEPKAGEAVLSAPAKKVYILPIRDDIMPPMVYIVRRGVKEAMAANADLVVLDMETNGGRLDSTKEIIDILDEFPGAKVTYVNREAYSAGAFIAVATEQIFMAPQSVIGAAAPMLMTPGGMGVENMPDSMEAKITSAVAARVRASAEKNGHNTEVVEAMINRTKELIIDGEVLNKEGQILTLTNVEAAREYGEPRRPLLSAGTVESLDALLARLGFGEAQQVRIEPTGVEKIASWINAISPILLIIGIVGIYLELKTPGFGVPGTVGVIAFAIYFLGGYIAGLSGMEWLAVFVLGLVLIGLELFLFPGTLLIGLAGALMVLVALVMAMVDVYPGQPIVPSFDALSLPLGQILIACLVSAGVIYLLGKLLPSTPFYSVLVSQTASGTESTAAILDRQANFLGREGVTLSPLRPGGKARFGEEIIDVVSQGELIPKDSRIRVVDHSGRDPVVELIS